KFLESRHDQNRRDLRLERHVAADEHDGAVLADAAREREAESGHQRRKEQRQNHVAKRLPARTAERRARVFRFRIEILENRLHRAHYEWKTDEYQHEYDPRTRIGTLESQRHQHLTEPARWNVQSAIHQSRHRGGQRKWKIHERIEQL